MDFFEEYNEKKNKKPKQAVALEYDPKEVAPKILAIGRGQVAERIIETAKKEDIPIHKDAKLAKTLSKLEIGDVIPPELYDVVAEVLVFVDRLEKIRGKLNEK